MNKGLNLRVYRRTLDNIALLWNKSALTPEQLQNIEIYRIDNNQRFKLKFATSSQMESILEEGIITPDDTVLAMINHDLNKLDPHMDYLFEIIFSNEYNAKIHVYSFGVLPPTERDDKKANAHMYGFVDDEKRWAKIPLIRMKDGTVAIPVKLIKDN